MPMRRRFLKGPFGARTEPEWTLRREVLDGGEGLFDFAADFSEGARAGLPANNGPPCGVRRGLTRPPFRVWPSPKCVPYSRPHRRKKIVGEIHPAYIHSQAEFGEFAGYF